MRKFNKGSIDKTEVLYIGAVVVIVLAIFGLIILNIAGLFNQNYYTVTVTDKGIKRSGDSDRYLIYTTLENGNIETFENTDNFFYGKFNSSNIYADLVAGSKYKIKVIGFRIPFLSRYQNIIEYEKIE